MRSSSSTVIPGWSCPLQILLEQKATKGTKRLFVNLGGTDSAIDYSEDATRTTSGGSED
jgi:hypothetical protein